MQKSFSQNVTSNPDKDSEQTKKELTQLDKNHFQNQLIWYRMIKNLDAFPLKSGAKQGCLPSRLLTSVLEVSAGAIRLGKINKTPRWARKSKNAFIWRRQDHLRLNNLSNVQKPKQTRPTEFSTIARYRRNIQTSTVCLYHSNERSEIEI